MGIGCTYFSSDRAAFGIQIIDAESKRGIPMVQLKTLNSKVYHTDNSGFIAYQYPDYLDIDMYFQIESSGYRYAKDPSGRQGVTLRLTPGRDTVLVMKRENLAERLYRITGSEQNVHRDVLQKNRTRQEIKGGVLGQDSNLATPFKGKIFWAWGIPFCQVHITVTSQCPLHGHQILA